MKTEVSQRTAYAVQLISKHTGKTCWLGTKHSSREAALEYVEREVCQRCNRFEVWPVPADWARVNRRDGFKEVRHVA